MDAGGVAVRPAARTDMAAVAAIYGWHVLHGVATFEEVPPDEAEVASRWSRVRDAGLPWLVAEADGEVAGYAFASPYNGRSGYRFTAEDSVYVAQDRQGLGLGRALLSAVIDACAARGLRQLVAAIGDSGNAGSIGLHMSLGFELAGVLKGVGFKHGRTLDVVWMQRSL